MVSEEARTVIALISLPAAVGFAITGKVFQNKYMKLPTEPVTEKDKKNKKKFFDIFASCLHVECKN